MSHYVIGVDGGGTRTRAVVYDSNEKVIGRAEGPASLADPHAPERAAEVIAAVARKAAEEAGTPIPCAALWAGIAGVGRETVRSGVQRALEAEGVAASVQVGTDVEAAFEDAFAGEPGILIVAGTGSIGWGRSEAGRVGKVGGWGSLLGDEGSGYAIGLEGLKRVARDVDGRGEDTRLAEELLAAIGCQDVDHLVGWVSQATKAEVAALVPVIAQAAQEGDAVAGEILVEAVEELEGHVLTLLNTLGPWSARPNVAMTGGLLDPGGPLRRGMEAMLRQHRIHLVSRTLVPAHGAGRLAAKLVRESREE